MSSMLWQLTLRVPPDFRGTQAQESHLYKFTSSWAVWLQGFASYTSVFSANFSRSGKGQISELGKEKAGLAPKANTAPHRDARASPDSAASECGEGNWGFGQLGSSLRSQVEARAQPLASNRHVGLLRAGAGAGVENLRPCFPFYSGALSLKGNTPLLSVVFSSFPLCKWRGK